MCPSIEISSTKATARKPNRVPSCSFGIFFQKQTPVFLLLLLLLINPSLIGAESNLGTQPRAITGASALNTEMNKKTTMHSGTSTTPSSQTPTPSVDNVEPLKPPIHHWQECIQQPLWTSVRQYLHKRSLLKPDNAPIPFPSVYPTERCIYISSKDPYKNVQSSTACRSQNSLMTH